MWHAHDGMGWWMLFGGVFWLVFLAAIIFALFYAVTHVERRIDGSGHAMEIARRRLARGEITPQEFEEIAKRLTPTSATGQH